MVILTLTEKGGEPRQLQFDKNEVTVGRVQGNDVVLAKGNVSKRHCRIYLQDGQFSVEDMKSTNGTYINGRKIGEPTVVSTADKIYVGDFVIRVDNATPAEVPTPAPPANEAGALSSALQRRPPPPPPPAIGRPTNTMRALEDDGREVEAPLKPRSSGRITLPPPPPPPRPGRAAPVDVVDDEPPPPPSASDIDLDDEPLAAQPPKLNVPPLRPPVMPSARADDEEKDEIPTATRDRSVIPAAAMPVPSEFPAWLRRLVDDGASSVYVNGSQVEVDKGGRREAASLSPSDSNGLADSLRALAGKGTPRPASDAPVVSVTLADGSRMVAFFPPAAAQVAAAIQRPGGVMKTLGDLVTEGGLSKEMQQVLEACSSTRRNLLIAGDRRAAELVLQAMANTIASRFRVAVLTDRVTPPQSGSWTKIALDAAGASADAIAAAVALRPDYLVLALTSPGAAAEVVQQCTLGQEGVFAAIGARSAHDGLARAEALARTALGAAARHAVATGFDVVVHATSLPDGGVRVVEIAEPRAEGESLTAEPLIAWRPEEGRSGGGGRFQPTGASGRLGATLAARGVQVPASVLRR